MILGLLLILALPNGQIKCLAKYGKDYEKYMEMVPYKIVPYLY